MRAYVDPEIKPAGTANEPEDQIMGGGVREQNTADIVAFCPPLSFPLGIKEQIN